MGTDTSLTNSDWVYKLALEIIENEDGSLNLIFEWDETDPDLQMWTEWGPKKQEEFILGALRASTTKE